MVQQGDHSPWSLIKELHQGSDLSEDLGRELTSQVPLEHPLANKLLDVLLRAQEEGDPKPV